MNKVYLVVKHNYDGYEVLQAHTNMLNAQLAKRMLITKARDEFLVRNPQYSKEEIGALDFDYSVLDFDLHV